MLLPGNQLIQALCRTLFHSLWQGLAVAVIAGIAIACTKKFRPQVRYTVFTCLLAVFIITTAVTFYYELNTIAPANTVSTGDTQVFFAAATNKEALLLPGGANPLTITESVLAYVNTHANAIVVCWLIVIAFRCIQMFTGLRGVYILKTKGTFDAGEYWNNRLKQLAANINVKARITLMQSIISKVPMVIGHFKPMILIPAGILTALPQDEIEAILLHELAHIRRKDYLVNMLQNFCGILFFFNPAVLWLSSLIKDERENCCDDIALTEIKNKKQFIHALISFQEYNMAASNYAVGFPGRKDHLLNRVKRIITNNNKTLTNMEKAFLATGILLVSFVTIAIAQNKTSPADKKDKTVQQADNKPVSDNANTDAIVTAATAGEDITPPQNAQDTVPATKESAGHSSSNITTSIDGKEYKLVEENDKVVDFYVNGEKVPADKIAQYQDVISRIHTEMKEQQKQFVKQQLQFQQQQQQFNLQQEAFKQQRKEFEKQQKLFSDSLQGKAFKQQQEMFKQQQEKFKEQQKQFEKQQETFRLQQQQFQKQLRDSGKVFARYQPMEPLEPMQQYAPAQPFEPMKPLEPIAPVTTVVPMPSISLPTLLNTISNLASAQVAKPVTVSAPVIVSAPVVSVSPVIVVAPVVQNKIITNIIADLQNENITVDVDKVSFTLTYSKLTVNGVTQPGALHDKFKNKYLNNSGDIISYSIHNNSATTKILSESK